MACIFNTVLLDLSAAMNDSFEGRGGLFEGGLLEDLRYGMYIPEADPLFSGPSRSVLVNP